MTVVPASPKDRITVNADVSLSGRARGVPFAKAAKHFAVLASDAKAGFSIALVDAGKCRIETGLNLGGDNSDTVTLDKVQPVTIQPAPQGFDQTRLMLMGGVARPADRGRAGIDAGNFVRYSNERVAFEKKISKFQAVQHNLARLAGESAAALARRPRPPTPCQRDHLQRRSVSRSGGGKIRCAEAAEKGGAIAHQVHGAIGFTIEHILHRYSLRALAWRDDFVRRLLGGRARQAGRQPWRR